MQNREHLAESVERRKATTPVCRKVVSRSDDCGNRTMGSITAAPSNIAGMRRDDVRKRASTVCVAKGSDGGDVAFQNSHGSRISVAKVNLGCESSATILAMDLLFSGPVQAINGQAAGAKRRPKWDGLTTGLGKN